MNRTRRVAAHNLARAEVVRAADRLSTTRAQLPEDRPDGGLRSRAPSMSAPRVANRDRQGRTTLIGSPELWG